MPSQASIFNKGTFTGTEFFTQLFYYRLLTTTYPGFNIYQGYFELPHARRSRPKAEATSDGSLELNNLMKS